MKRHRREVTAGLIVAGVEVNGAERDRERRRPPDWSSFISPGMRGKCQPRCWEFISPATCIVIVLYSVSHLDYSGQGHANERLKIAAFKSSAGNMKVRRGMWCNFPQ